MGNLVGIYNWMKVRQGRVTYSQAARNGPASFDCSSAVSYAMREAGYNVPVMNTDSMFVHLPKVGFQRVGAPYKFGDIFIMGIEGSSGGNNGHTGVFIDATNVIHCTSVAGGIIVSKFTDVAGSTPYTVFRDPNGSEPTRPGTDAPAVPDLKTILDTIEKQTAYSICEDLLADGWTMEAAIGAIANAAVESGLKPDTDQINGPAYGLWQWDGSSYPLVPPATYNGRQYVQNLLSAAEISGDYRDAKVQTKLMIWSLTNGQWIGAVEPTRIADYKALKDIRLATLVFVRNYERAGIENLNKRYEAADYWYNFLKNLPSGSEPGSGNEPSTPTLENGGEVEAVYIMGNEVRIVGWHFSSFGDKERLLIFDAQTDKEVARKEITLTKRPDIAKQHEEIPGIELCGIDVTIELPERGVFYGYFERYGEKTFDLKISDLIFTTKKIKYAQAKNIPDFCGVFVEIVEKGEVIFETEGIINPLDTGLQLNQIPSLDLKIPCDDSFDLRKGRKEFNIYFHGHIFNGLINDLKIIDGFYEIDVVHALDEWRSVQTPMNRAFKQATLPQVLTDAQIGFNDDWAVVFDAEATRFKFDYVFSKMTKLEVLDRIKEFSEIDWRVSLKSHRTLEIGVFGEKKEVYLSNEDECDATILNLEEGVNFSNIYNVLSVTSDSGDATESKTTLREVYLSKSYKKEFPVVITDYTANNEQKFYYTDITEIASNNSKEYMILDNKGISDNDGVIVEKNLSINDLSPISLDNEALSNEDRSVIVQQIYNQGVKELTRGRRRSDYPGRTTFMHGVNVGDRVFVSFYPGIDCGSCQTEIEGWLYVNSLGFEVKENTIIHEVELSTEKRIDE